MLNSKGGGSKGEPTAVLYQNFDPRAGAANANNMSGSHGSHFYHPTSVDSSFYQGSMGSTNVTHIRSNQMDVSPNVSGLGFDDQQTVYFGQIGQAWDWALTHYRL